MLCVSTQQNGKHICFPCVVFSYSSIFGCCASQYANINNLNNVAHINFTKSWLRTVNSNILPISRSTTLSVAVNIAAYNIPLCQKRERQKNYLKLYKFRAVVFYALVLFPTTAQSYVVCSFFLNEDITKCLDTYCNTNLYVSTTVYITQGNM